MKECSNPLFINGIVLYFYSFKKNSELYHFCRVTGGGITLKFEETMAFTNFSNISFLPPNLLKVFKNYMVPPPPNFLNIKFLPLNSFKSFKRYEVCPLNSFYFLYDTLNWFNFYIYYYFGSPISKF